jgi:hypothetical protein
MLENLDTNPVADRMLLNIIRYAQNQTAQALEALPADLEQRFHQIGYYEASGMKWIRDMSLGPPEWKFAVPLP